MKKAFSFLVLVFLCGTFSARLSAELSMPHIFADHMVLQRNEAINLWGSASPKEKVTVELNGQKTSVRADASGKWYATLRPMEAGGPYTLIVKGKKECLAFDDVLLGEVWICSGQSNMEFRLHAAMNAEKEIADAENYSFLRSFNVKQEMSHRPLSDLQGEWRVCDISEKWYLPSYSKDDWKEVSVPGLWSEEELVSLDGVVWQTCRFTLSENYVGKEAVLSLHVIDDDDITWIHGQKIGETVGYDVRRLYSVPAGVLKESNEITLKISDYRGGGGLYGPANEIYLKVGDKTIPLSGKWKYKVSASNSDFDFVEYGPNAYPSLLYNAMVNPLVGLSMQGVIWYQGENNTNRAKEYYHLFPAMINDWRKKWGKDFPFYWVQLANYMDVVEVPSESLWAQVREAQTQTLSLSHTGQAVIIDIGEAKDIHPKNKQEVGRRLALHALHNDYGFSDVVCESPMPKTVRRVQDKIVVQFDNVADGLIVKNKYGYLMSFAVAGNDGVYKWVQAKVAGKDRVVLSCPDVIDPVSVRYAWGDNPDDANLYNSVGLPATPFEIKIE